jgi:hypothetical protein
VRKTKMQIKSKKSKGRAECSQIRLNTDSGFEDKEDKVKDMYTMPEITSHSRVSGGIFKHVLTIDQKIRNVMKKI